MGVSSVSHDVIAFDTAFVIAELSFHSWVSCVCLLLGIETYLLDRKHPLFLSTYTHIVLILK